MIVMVNVHVMLCERGIVHRHLQMAKPAASFAKAQLHGYTAWGAGRLDIYMRCLHCKASDSNLAPDYRDDPLLKIAMKLEEVALKDDYFVSRHLYPNVDFYSGIVLRALGIPVSMYTVLFAVRHLLTLP